MADQNQKTSKLIRRTFGPLIIFEDPCGVAGDGSATEIHCMEHRTVWNAGAVLAYLAPDSPLRAVASASTAGAFPETLLRAVDRLARGTKVHILELGSGTGLVGLSFAQSGASVALTDLPPALPLLELNIRANPCLGRVQASAFDWAAHDDQATLARLVSNGTPHLILASDVLYEPRNYSAFAGALEAVAGPSTVCLIAHDEGYTESGPNARALGALLKRLQRSFGRVTELTRVSAIDATAAGIAQASSGGWQHDVVVWEVGPADHSWAGNRGKQPTLRPG
jgi:hypothetical protein